MCGRVHTYKCAYACLRFSTTYDFVRKCVWGGISLYLYAPFTDFIYLFIYFFQKRKSVGMRVCECVCMVLFCTIKKVDFKPIQ